MVVFGIIAVMPLLWTVFVDAEANSGLALVWSCVDGDHGIKLGLLIIDRLVGGIAWIVAGEVRLIWS